MPINLAPMAERDELQFVLLNVELVDDAVVACAQAELGTSLKAMVRMGFQALPQLPNLGLD